MTGWANVRIRVLHASCTASVRLGVTEGRGTIDTYDAAAFEALTTKVRELAEICDRLSEENAELRRRVEGLLAGTPYPVLGPTLAADTEVAQAKVEGSDRPVDRCSRTDTVSRRAIGKAIGAAAVGVAGAAVLLDVRSGSAAAAVNLRQGPRGQSAAPLDSDVSDGASVAGDRAPSYRLFPTTRGPSTPVTYSGPFDAGIVFEVTSGGVWFEGYWWWVCPSGQSASPQKFALWQLYSGGASIVKAADVTSGKLTAGRWNYVRLRSPVNLSIGGGHNFDHADAGGTACYIACTTFKGSFPDTSKQFGHGDRYAAGVQRGPLTAFSDQSGSHPGPFGIAQGVFSTTGSVTSGPPSGGSESGNFWMDVQVSSSPPVGYRGSYRIWPNFPRIPGSVSNDTHEQTTGTEFWLSEPCKLDNIWFWSPPGVTVLPSRCGIFSVATQSVVSATDNASPSWSGRAGSGWVACSYSRADVVLPAGKYKTCVYSGALEKFYQEDVDYFSSGPGLKNIVNGPLTCPNTSNSSSPGNSTYQDGPWSYPETFDYHDDGENRFIDVEVTPLAHGKS